MEFLDPELASVALAADDPVRVSAVRRMPADRSGGLTRHQVIHGCAKRLCGDGPQFGQPGGVRIVPVSFAHELEAAVLDAGGEVEIHLFPGEEHGFNAFWADSYSEDVSEQTFDLTMAFLETRFEY